MAGCAPGRAARAARRLLAFQAVGITRSASPAGRPSSAAEALTTAGPDRRAEHHGRGSAPGPACLTLPRCGSRSASYQSAPSHPSTWPGPRLRSPAPPGKVLSSRCSPKGRKRDRDRPAGRRLLRSMARSALVCPKPRATHGVAVVAESLSRAPDGRVYNTTVAIDATGRLVASYRKIHLFDALGQRESDLVAPGSDLVIAEAGRPSSRAAHLLRREVSRAGPGAGAGRRAAGDSRRLGPAGLFKEEHWVTLVRARAIENTIWVAAAGQVPDPAEPPTGAPTGIGRSMLVDPMGAVRVDLGSAECVAAGEAGPRDDPPGPGRAALPGQPPGGRVRRGCRAGQLTAGPAVTFR